MKNKFKFTIILIAIFSIAFVAMNMKRTTAEEAAYSISIVLDGGNGTPDGAQANRDYSWRVDRPPICDIYEFEVVNVSSTGYHNWGSNDLLTMWWKSSYVGTTQQITASCYCEDYYGNVSFPTVTKTITIHN